MLYFVILGPAQLFFKNIQGHTDYVLEVMDLSDYYVYILLFYVFDVNATYINRYANVRSLTGVINIRSTKEDMLDFVISGLQ